VLTINDKTQNYVMCRNCFEENICSTAQFFCNLLIWFDVEEFDSQSLKHKLKTGNSELKKQNLKPETQPLVTYREKNGVFA
jgi:hypothetical protein